MKRLTLITLILGTALAVAPGRLGAVCSPTVSGTGGTAVSPVHSARPAEYQALQPAARR